MNNTPKIQLPRNLDLIKFIQKIYDLSTAQGLGIMQFIPAQPLSNQYAQQIIDRSIDDNRIAISMDYVHGRACKMTVFREGADLYIPYRWFDHFPDIYRELLTAMNIPFIDSLIESGV